MRTNHSPLQFFGLIATVSVLASGVYANAAQAATIASTTKANGASASPVPVGSSSASQTGTRNLVDGTRTAVDSNRTSRALRSVTATTAAAAAANAAATTGRFLSPSSGPAASGSATSSQQLVQVTTPAAPANAAPRMPASQAPPVDIGVTPLVGGGNLAGAPTSVTVPSATTTTPAPTDPSPADSAAATPVATQLPARQPAATKPATTESQATRSTTTTAPTDLSPADSAAGTPVATQLSAQHAPATQPAAMKPATTEPQATPSTTTPAVATPPSATSPVATGPVATEPVAAQSLKARSASLSPGNRTRRLHQLQTLVTRWLRAENVQAAPPVTPSDSPLSPAPPHASLGLARGPLGSAMGSPRVIAAGADLESGSASVTAAPRRPEEPPAVARPHAAMAPPIPQALSPAPPVQTRLPVGGAAAATGGGIGSVAPSVVAEFEALALALATMLLARFSLDHAAWRSILLASRLERPG